jgi:class 3 adenylate cyclase
VPRLQRTSFDEPETVREFPNGSVVSVALDETVLGPFRFEPGWRWSNHVRPTVGTDSCQNNAAMREQIGHYRGREVDTSGDGFFAMFDGPARAVRCDLAMAKAAQGVGASHPRRLHTGEVMLVAENARGVAVHMAARVMALANADEVFVSGTTRDLLAGSGFALDQAGTFELKGLTGAREDFRVVG